MERTRVTADSLLGHSALSRLSPNELAALGFFEADKLAFVDGEFRSVRKDFYGPEEALLRLVHENGRRAGAAIRRNFGKE